MAKHTGGCLCGMIRYEVTGDPIRAAHCHCDDCRRATGASFATNVFFREVDVKVIQGKVAQFEHTADSGNIMTKQFCANCGSQIFGIGSGSSGIKHVKVGTLDDASFVQPQIEVYTGKALQFTTLSEETEHFEGMRPT